MRKLYANIARSYQMLRNYPAALASCAEGLSLDAEDAELLFRKAVVHRSSGDSAEAQRCWRRILTLLRPKKFASLDQGIYGHLTRRNLAALAKERGDLEIARQQWRAVLEECPGDRGADAPRRDWIVGFANVGRRPWLSSVECMLRKGVAPSGLACWYVPVRRTRGLRGLEPWGLRRRAI